jgi:hypothetical protein
MSRARAWGDSGQLERLAGEIERWNDQINLVSRVQTRRRIDALLEQCRVGWNLVHEELVSAEWFTTAGYIDLGSGGGLPGLVWSCARDVEGHDGWSLLVEPREKRAWFLQRTGRLLGLSELRVLPARWGECSLPWDLPVVSGVLVSLKALRLNDDEILGGLQEALRADPWPKTVAIARFLDPQRPDLGDLEPDFVATGDRRPWRHQRSVVLGADNPGILLTYYEHPA